MAPCVRETVVKATPAAIWSAALEPMEWEKWDPDVEKLEEVSGPCADGTTFIFVMKEGIKRIPVSLSEVVEHKTVRFAGSVLAGMMKFDGFLEFSELEAGETTTVKYTFEMAGPLGSLLYWAKPELVVGGVEKGLENIKTLGEAA